MGEIDHNRGGGMFAQNIGAGAAGAMFRQNRGGGGMFGQNRGGGMFGQSRGGGYNFD